jgi:hypothetical protein
VSVAGEPGPTPDTATLAARLAHDVGKYIARAAKNIRGDDVPPVLVDMLASDLYELRDGRRASEIFAERVASLADLADPRLGEVAQLLVEADRLEPQLRAAAPDAVARGAEIALRVAALLGAVARDAGEDA